mmetsp:Transcript_39210/g.67789  ORF Transcript_39210/g.67789 Transcript_39210/m.67789 type:complete len:180 (+) Transcript_39210:85-624(+)
MVLPAHGTKVITMDMKKKELTSWELYQQERLPSILTWLFGAGLFAFAFSLYLGTSTDCDAAMGNKFKGKGPLIQGAEGLKSGEFIATCSSRLDMSCGTPKIFFMDYDGELALYKGYIPAGKGEKMWSADSSDYPSKSMEYVAKYEKSGALSITKKGKKVFTLTKANIPEVLREWPLSSQ